MKVLAGTSNSKLSKDIARQLKLKLVNSNIKRFADGEVYIEIKSVVKSNYSTGLEIEALNSVSCASITTFDMLKSFKKKIIIKKIEIIKKRGGKNNIGWYF